MFNSATIDLIINTVEKDGGHSFKLLVLVVDIILLLSYTLEMTFFRNLMYF